MKLYDVIIVGAGPSGMLVYETLRARGANVLLIDAGPKGPIGCYPPPVDESIWRYQSHGALAEWPRVYAVGGRTLSWGGFSYRFPNQVFSDGDWPYLAQTLHPYYRVAERWLGVVEGKLTDQHRSAARKLGWPFLPLRGARKDRQVWTALHSSGARQARPHHRATLLDYSAEYAKGIQVTINGATEQLLRARCYVLAASPLETTRLLLASGLRKQSPNIGCRLVDHPSVSYMLIEPESSPNSHGNQSHLNAALLNGALVPRFVNTNAQSKRPYRGGFSIEIIGPQPLSSLGSEAHAVLQLPESRTMNYRVTYLHGLGETSVHRRRYVDLVSDLDMSKRVLDIHMAWSAAEKRLIEDMKCACIQVADELATPNSELILIQDPIQNRILFHEAGTCVMGHEPDSVCDPWGRLRALANVWVADASVFPSAGDRHPTLTVLAHALRVGKSVGRQLNLS